ncbi:DUF4271 domain-containing protein [Runella zeae]|uniref:DUF4271 domain-containing protein n=1 Tax=Runella zeae TaxID=94255 RepID=UPI00068917D0|nr:DUF4271 domain-containing protein [Runella zeae]
MTKNKTLRSFKYAALLWLFCYAAPLWAEVGPNKQYFLVKDLSQDWIVYDQREKEFVPYVAEQHNTQLSVNTIIDLESNLHYNLLIYVENDNYLFFNGALQDNLKAGQWRVMRIDSLYKIYKRPQLMITIYGTPGQLGKTVFIGHQKAAIEKLITIEEESFLNLKPREEAEMSNFFILAMLLLLGFMAFLFNGYPRAFEKMYSIGDLLQVDVRDESFLINKPFSRVNILFLVLLSLEVAYLYLFAQDKQYNLFSSKELLVGGQSPLDHWFTFFKIAILCFVMMIVKYLGLYILGTLYRLEGIANLHYFKVVQSSLWFYGIILLVVSVASFYVLEWSTLLRTMLIIPGVVFYVLRTILIFFTITSSITVKNLYIISYLCIVEFIPLIIGVRYAL